MTELKRKMEEYSNYINDIDILYKLTFVKDIPLFKASIKWFQDIIIPL